jgi:septal ring factor EnvC (AmiA/AmiB activator)
MAQGNLIQKTISEKKQIESEIRKIQLDINQQKNKELQNKQRINRVIEDAELANRQLLQIKKQREEALLSLRKSKEKLANLTDNINQTKHQVALVLNRLNKNHALDVASLVLSDATANQKSRDYQYYKHLVGAQQQLINDLHVQSQQLAKLSQQLDKQLVYLNQAQQHTEKKIANFNQMKQTTSKTSAEIEQAIQLKAQRLATLKANEKELNIEINKALATAKQTSKKPKPPTKPNTNATTVPKTTSSNTVVPRVYDPITNERDDVAPPSLIASTTADTTDLASLPHSQTNIKQLVNPVDAPISGRFGTSRRGGGLWKGIFYNAPKGTPVVAAATGRIVFADVIRGFGKTMIIDHGNTYMTVYAGLETFNKSVGSSVNANALIGYAGELTDDEDGIYFELRHAGKQLNPKTLLPS